jgi:hypothetical protein
MYIVSSHWNAETQELHGRSYDSLDAALDAIGSHITDDGWLDTDDDGRTCDAIGVYSSDADREANAYGAAPHLCLAVVRMVRARDEDHYGH